MRIQVLETLASRTAKLESFDFPDPREVVIGRDSSCDLRVDNPENSRRHARIVWDNGQAFIEDLESSNGTFLNDKSVRRAALKNNDQIKIGGYVFTVTGLPEFAASVQLHDQPTNITVSLKQDEADLLAGKTVFQPRAADGRQQEVAQKLRRITQLVADSRNADETIAGVLDEVQVFLAADTACLLLWNPESGDWQVVATSRHCVAKGPVSVSRAIIRQALQEGEAIVSENAMADMRFAASQSIIAQGISSAICAPIRIGARFGGVLFIDRRKRLEAYTVADLHLAATVAGILTLFLHKERVAAGIG